MSKENSANNLISIIIPTFNREKYLQVAINSVLNQTINNWELLIVDDGSEDDTLSLVKKYINQHTNIRYFFHKNRGAAYAMNVGMESCKGDFITFLGSDDEYLPNHLELRLEYLSENKNIDLLHSPAKIIGNEFVKDKYNLSKNIHLDECILGGTLFGKAEVFHKLNGFKVVNYSPESEFIERAEKIYKIEKLNLRTYVYNRDTPDGICNNI
ncbi:MAG: glycosyltransferase [Bacteroidetes bacterium]|nr:glycosyltransferase [Bacteroidota bacterium]MBU1116712.1 glycosyltransferase [Bacteroidota bacterium]MBU1799828.1 glycosyltransferase [Bacteroidota bacterium]